MLHTPAVPLVLAGRWRKRREGWHAALVGAEWLLGGGGGDAGFRSISWLPWTIAPLPQLAVGQRKKRTLLIVGHSPGHFANSPPGLEAAVVVEVEATTERAARWARSLKRSAS